MENRIELLASRSAGPQMAGPDGQPIDQLKLIEACGRTCYKSQDKISDDSARAFIGALMKSGHEAMLEFSWLTFQFTSRSFPDICHWLAKVLEAEAVVKVSMENKRVIMSGNFRSFRDLLRNVRCDYPEQDFTPQRAIAAYLYQHHRQLLSGVIEGDTYAFRSLSDSYSNFQAMDCYDFEHTEASDFEKIKHHFAVGRFIGSRAFTHQLVRHRKSSFAQESQRYCDESGFFDNDYYIIPPSFKEAGFMEAFLGKLREINCMYQKALSFLESTGLKGKKLKEDGRFLLPNAVASEICVAGNLEQWFRVFKLRCDSHAQWEIRCIMEQFQKQLFAAMPEAEELYKIYCKQ